MGKSNAAKPPSTTATGVTPADSKSLTPRQTKKTNGDYTSDGVEDNDVFLLPISDYQVMLLVTIIGAVVRLFRIYQPTSVVFEDVQYGYCAIPTLTAVERELIQSPSLLASVGLLLSISRANSSWMFTLLWPKC